MPEMLFTGKQDSREGTSQVLTPSNPGHQPSPNSTPCRRQQDTHQPPLLLSTSAPDDTTSRIGAASDHTVVSSMHTETTAKTEPSSAFLFSKHQLTQETGAQRVRGTTFPLGHPSIRKGQQGLSSCLVHPLMPKTRLPSQQPAPWFQKFQLVWPPSHHPGSRSENYIPFHHLRLIEETSTHPSMTEKHTREP